jgi:hypothetical protein
MEQIRDARKQTHNKYSQPIFDKAKATQWSKGSLQQMEMELQIHMKNMYLATEISQKLIQNGQRLIHKILKSQTPRRVHRKSRWCWLRCYVFDITPKA